MYDSMTAEVEVLEFLRTVVTTIKPELVVETGTFQELMERDGVFRPDLQGPCSRHCFQLGEQFLDVDLDRRISHVVRDFCHIVFHVVFGKTVPDVSLNAVANLGYADGRFGALLL